MSVEKYPALKRYQEIRIVPVFGITCCCEALFSKFTQAKVNHLHARLTGDNSERQPKLVSTTVEADEAHKGKEAAAITLKRGRV